MIIRKIRPEENGKVFAVRSLGYGFKIDVLSEEKIKLDADAIGAFTDDDETLMGMAYIHEYKANYCGEFVPCLGIGEIATRPEFRRNGAVRRILKEIFKMAPQRGWVTSVLYPFSFDYYRKFGYERMVKRMKMKVKSSALSCCERNYNVKLYSYKNKEVLSDILEVYNTYAKKYNLMFMRDESTDAYSLDPFNSGRHTYIHYSDENEPLAVATIEVYDEEKVDVSEICYKNAEGLRGMIGFLRAFDGQVKEFCFDNLPQTTELELVFGEYAVIEYSTDSRAMGRIMQVEEALKRNVYPAMAGRFRLRCEDELEFNRAVFDVQYKNGKASIKKMPYDSEFDISCEVHELSRIILNGGYDVEKAQYLTGVTIKENADDFFRAFKEKNVFLNDFF